MSPAVEGAEERGEAREGPGLEQPGPRPSARRAEEEEPAPAADRPARAAGGVHVPTAVLLLVIGIASFLGVDALAQSVRAESFGWIDPRCSRLAEADAFDPRWSDWMAHRLAALPKVHAADLDGVADLVRAVEEMPFVAEVRNPEIRWPDGLDLAVRLHRPVACVRRGAEFLAVAEDGTLLPGNWSAPPTGDWAPLPVIGPIDDTFRSYRPGDFLVEQRHLDALAVAVSMGHHLPPQDQKDLGPVVIDATAAEDASVEEPGVRLLLGERRLVLFGRSPVVETPGELPAAYKWASLGSVLAQRRARVEEGWDWSLADVRWDRPEVRLRAEAAAGASSR